VLSGYAPNSLGPAIAALMRIYNAMNRTEINFWRDGRMRFAFDVMDAEIARMQSIGWKLPQRALEFSSEESKLILGCCLLDASSPAGLLFRLYFILAYMISTRREIHYALERKMFHPDKCLVDLRSGRKYFRLPFVVDKNHRGGMKFLGREEQLAYIVWNNPNEPGDDVHSLIQQYFSHLPADLQSDRFYWNPIPNPRTAVWYKRIPSGEVWVFFFLMYVCWVVFETSFILEGL